MFTDPITQQLKALIRDFTLADPAFQTTLQAAIETILTTRGDVLRRGASEAERLALGAANTLLSSDGTDVKYQTISALLDTVIGDDQGTILKRGASAWEALAPADGYLNNASGVVSWQPSSVVQIVPFVSGAATSTTSTIPTDNTIPQITEGAQLQSGSFTPKLSTSKLLIEWTGFISGAAATNSFAVVTLFQSGSTDAIDTKYGFHDSTVLLNWTPKLSAVMDSWGTDARTISVRYGGSAGETIYAGSTVGGTARFGGTMNSVLTITEFKN